MTERAQVPPVIGNTKGLQSARQTWLLASGPPVPPNLGDSLESLAGTFGARGSRSDGARSRSDRLFATALRFATVVALAGLAALAAAQGTQSDYQRADSLQRRVRGRVLNEMVLPHWIGGSSRFWYREELPGGRSRFLLVDPQTATRSPAFDHARLAAALSRELGKPVQADRLPVTAIAFSEGGKTLRIQVGDRPLSCDLATYSLRDADEPLSLARPLPLHGRPIRSRDGGPETSITFVNRTSSTVSIFWADTEGRDHPYGTVQPGAKLTLHTYAGHAWLARTPEGEPVAAFAATLAPSWAVIEPGKTAPEPPSPNPAVSPDGKWRILFRDWNAILREVATERDITLTRDGSEADSYGGEPVWSPDSLHVMILKTVPEQKHTVYEVESSPADQLQPKLHTMQYLKPGDRMEHPRPHLFEVPNGHEITIADTLFPNPFEISRFHWSPDSKQLFFLYNQRGHQVMRLVSIDANSGQARTVIDETASTFIDWTNKVYLRFLDPTHEAIWMSERGGWAQLYLYDTDSGKVKNRITNGQWVVRLTDGEPVRVDDAKREIWFNACGVNAGEDPYYLHQYRVNFDGTGFTSLTEGDGDHTVTYSPDDRYLIDSFSRVDLPPVTVLRRADTGAAVLDLERADPAPLLQTGWRYPERFTAKGRDGKTEIYGVIFRPSTFNPARKYPVLEQIYAGPQGAFVPKPFSASHGAQQMAELGFIVVQIDGMGTNFRSRAFHDVCFKNLSDAGFPDRILWIRAAATRYPYMDLSRMGIYGTSAGGQNALGGLLLHGDFYKAGVADCGCHDNRMDKLWWNEQWMGWPVGPEYAADSNVTLAPRLTGKLLLMVGELDTNVDPASTMQVVNALIKANRDFELLVMPGADHGVAGTPYGHRRLEDFFVRSFLKVEPRATG